MAMKLVRQLPLNEGGSCSNCDQDYTALSGVRALCEYQESNGNHTYRLTEPFNFCKECYGKLKEGEL